MNLLAWISPTTIFFIIFIAVVVVMMFIAQVRYKKRGDGRNSSENTQFDSGKDTDFYVDEDIAGLDGKEIFEKSLKFVDEDGYKNDYGQWLNYITAAAHKGYPPAMRELGLYYKFENNEKAEEWLRRAADNGDGQAVTELAELYIYGVEKGQPEIEKDVQKAVDVLKPYAERGMTEAFKMMGYICYYKLDDEKSSFDWYLKAAEAGDAEGMKKVADLYYFDEENEKAEEWYLKAAEQNYADAECSLGNFYGDGFNGSPDYKKAFEWYKRAADHGDSFAACRMGEMYISGEGVEKDERAAVEIFKKVAEDSSPYGEYLYGKCFMEGIGVERDVEKGLKLYLEAAKYDDDAKYALGMCYLEGTVVKKNVKLAVDYLDKAGPYTNDGAAAYVLGELYYAGKEVKKDEEKAHKYWVKAAKMNHEGAKECLKLYFGENFDEED